MYAAVSDYSTLTEENGRQGERKETIAFKNAIFSFKVYFIIMLYKMKMLCEGLAFGRFLRFYNSKSIKDRTFFLFAIDS